MEFFHSEHHNHFLLLYQVGVVIKFKHTNYFFNLRNNDNKSISNTLFNLYLLAHSSSIFVEVLQCNKEIEFLYDSNRFKLQSFIGSDIFRIYPNNELVAIFVTAHAHDRYYLTIHEKISPIEVNYL